MSAIVIYHNGQCAKCRRIAKFHKTFDWLKRISIATESPPSGPLALGEIAVKDLRSGAFLKGADAVRLIVRQVPLYWPLLPFLKIPFIARKAAANVRACDDDGTCAI